MASERARELRDLAQAKGIDYRAGRVGAWAQVVVEGSGGTGLTEDYLRVSVVGVGEPTVRRVVSGTLLGSADHLYIDSPHDPPPIPA